MVESVPTDSLLQLQIVLTAATGVLGTAGSVFIVWMQTRADKKLTKIEKTEQDIHSFVNSNMGIQLKLVMDLSEYKAKATKSPTDIEAARYARQMYEEHVQIQRIVDSRKTPRHHE